MLACNIEKLGMGLGSRDNTLLNSKQNSQNSIVGPWPWQAHQERSYQEYLATKAVERAQQQEAYYDQLMTSHQSEVTALKNQVVSLKRDLDAIKTRYNETSEKLMEKTRQYQKLQVRDLIKELELLYAVKLEEISKSEEGY